MKGQKKIKIDGDEITLRLDLNAIINFCEEYDIDFSGWEQALNDPKKIRNFVYQLAKSGGSDVKEEDLGKLGFDQISEVVGMVSEAAGNVPGGEEEK